MASAVIGALRVNLSADTAEFKRNLNSAERMAEKFGRAIGSTVRAGALALAAGVAAAGTALVALTKHSMSTIDAQAKLAARVGASVSAIQTLQHAGELAGVGQEALAKTLGVLNARLGEAARTGAGPAYEALQRLGLSARELSEMDADERIKALSDAMKEAGYTTQQMSDTLKNLGVRNQEINNLFIEGSAAIDEAHANLVAWGVALSDVDAKKVEMANDAMSRISTVMEGVGNQLAIRLSPLLQAVAEYITDAAKETGGFGAAIDKAISLGIRLWAAINREVYDFRISLDAAGSIAEDIANTFRDAPNIIDRMFGNDPGAAGPDEVVAEVEKQFGHLRETLAKPPSDAEWDAWWADIKAKSDAAAAALANATKPGGGEGDDGSTEAGDKAALKLQEELDQRLVALQESLYTEREAELASYAERLADLQEFYDKGMITAQEYADLRLGIEKDHAAKLTDIYDDLIREQQRAAAKQRELMFGIADNIGSALNSIFGESKAVAIGQALINTAQAVTKTLAQYGATPWGLAAAAAAAAAGAAQIAAIRSTTSKGGGSSPKVSSGASSAASSADTAGSNQTLFINGLSSSSLFSGESVRELAAKLIEFQRDGGKVVLAPA